MVSDDTECLAISISTYMSRNFYSRKLHVSVNLIVYIAIFFEQVSCKLIRVKLYKVYINKVATI